MQQSIHRDLGSEFTLNRLVVFAVTISHLFNNQLNFIYLLRSYFEDPFHLILSLCTYRYL